MRFHIAQAGGVACTLFWRPKLLCRYWILYTPEFRLLVVLISTPFAMLVALWGMTGARALEIIAVNRETK
jgi:hypothetical protein